MRNKAGESCQAHALTLTCLHKVCINTNEISMAGKLESVIYTGMLLITWQARETTCNSQSCS